MDSKYMKAVAAYVTELIHVNRARVDLRYEIFRAIHLRHFPDSDESEINDSYFRHSRIIKVIKDLSDGRRLTREQLDRACFAVV